MRDSRYLALAAVLALHLALIAAMLAAARTRRVLIASARPLEILVLSPEAKPGPAARPAIDHPRMKRERSRIAALSADVAEPGPAAPIGDVPDAAVDWDEEARAVAAAKAGVDAAPPAPTGAAQLRSTSPFAPPPAHHAGEEFTTVTGQRAVYINQNCYQVASPSSYSPNASNNGMGVQTYCNRRSGAARGDLFEQLTAYKKHHPNP